MTKRGRPSNAELASLRPPTKRDYTRLAMACISAILSGETDILLAVSQRTKFPRDFPKGIRKVADGLVTQRIKAHKLLTWLHENGYTPFSVEMLRQQQIKMSGLINSIEGEL